MTIPGTLVHSVTLSFWIALVTGAVLAYPIYRLLLLTKSRQTVSQYAPTTHQTKQGTPTMGGLIIVAAFLVAGAVLAGLTTSGAAVVGIGPATMFLFAGYAAIGFVDDFVIPRLIKGKRGLGWKQKFLLQAIVAGAAAYAGGGALDVRWALTVFLVMFVANAYNFVDGLDALAGSVLLAFGAGLSLLSLSGLVVPEPAVICAALMGGAIPFLFLNAPPAKVFMGDVGSLPIGAVLGLGISSVLAPRAQALLAPAGGSVLDEWHASRMIEGTLWRHDMALPLAILCLVLVIELVPVPIQIAWVKLFKRRLFPFTPIHHAFEKAGWPETRVVWSFALSQIVLVALALLAYQALPPLSIGGGPSMTIEARR